MEIDKKDLEEYQNAIKIAVVNHTLEEYGEKAFNNNFFLIKFVSHTNFYKKIHLEILEEFKPYEPLGMEEDFIFAEKVDLILSNDFKREIMSIWLNKVNLNTYFNGLDYIIGSLSNLGFLGINNVFFINEELNQMIQNSKISNINSDYLESLIEYGFYLEDNTLNLADDKLNDIESLEKNKKNGILFLEFKLKEELKNKSSNIKKSKI